MSASAVTSTTEDSVTFRCSGAVGVAPPVGRALGSGAEPTAALAPGKAEGGSGSVHSRPATTRQAWRNLRKRAF
eukprot:11679298-Alexandrium_andersonii.AAC.1